MTTINKEPYTLVLHRGRNPEIAADRAAAYIINRWLPNNAGGVHMLVTPKLKKVLLNIYDGMEDLKDTGVKIRVTVENNIPHLEVV